MISIIIPTLNEENHLPLLLQSIKNQDFKGEYEVIVADAGSSDKTIEIARSFGCKITKGGLPAKGRNEGAKIAKGDLFLFVDADVILPKDFLRRAIEEFSSRDLDCAGFLAKPSSKKLIYKFIFWAYNSFAILSERFFPCGWMAILTKRETHFKTRGFDEEIKIGEDHWYVKNAQKIGNFGVIKSAKIIGSTRRFEKDGTIITCLKYIFVGLYMLFFGPLKRNIIKYEFNHYKDN